MTLPVGEDEVEEDEDDDESFSFSFSLSSFSFAWMTSRICFSSSSSHCWNSWLCFRRLSWRACSYWADNNKDCSTPKQETNRKSKQQKINQNQFSDFLYCVSSDSRSERGRNESERGTMWTKKRKTERTMTPFFHWSELLLRLLNLKSFSFPLFLAPCSSCFSFFSVLRVQLSASCPCLCFFLSSNSLCPSALRLALVFTINIFQT